MCVCGVHNCLHDDEGHTWWGIDVRHEFDGTHVVCGLLVVLMLLVVW